VAIAIFASLVPKILAPILVFVDLKDANESSENSSVLVKDFYLRTFFLAGYAWLLIIALALLPNLIKLVGFSAWWVEEVFQVLFILLGPWSFALLLVQKYDLQLRKKQSN